MKGANRTDVVFILNGELLIDQNRENHEHRSLPRSLEGELLIALVVSQSSLPWAGDPSFRNPSR